MLAMQYLQEIEKGDKSHFYLFLKNWPDTDDFPQLYNEEERDLLKGSPILKKLDRIEEKFVEDYDFLVKHIPEIGRFSYLQFKKAMLLCSSRNFGVNIDGNSTNVMVPLSDMLNHAQPYQATWTYSNGRGGFLMTAEMDIKKDEEIFDSYGKKSSYTFLLHYAFIF